MVTDIWLKELNEEFRRKDVEPKARPFLAFQKYVDDSKFALSFSSPEADQIFKWFSDNLPTVTG